MVRRQVSSKKIEAVALEQASAQGFENLSLIGVARQLGIKSPSLFNHIKGLDDLKQRVTMYALKSLKEALENAVQQKAGEAAVMSLALAYREWVKKNSGLYPALRSVGPLSEPELSDLFYGMMKTMVSVFITAGLSEDEQVHQGRALRSMLHGWAELERAGSFSLGKDIDWSYARMVSSFAKNAFDMS